MRASSRISFATAAGGDHAVERGARDVLGGLVRRPVPRFFRKTHNRYYESRARTHHRSLQHPLREFARRSCGDGRTGRRAASA